MSEREKYFDQAESWSTDTRALAARSRRTAWSVAGVAVALAGFEAVALAMLAPLKTVQPVTLLVDRQTGYVQAIDPLTPKRIAADEALTDAYLAQYVMAREGFDRATVAAEYRRVALWSTGRARESYLAHMPATNPDSPFQLYPAGTIVDARVKSVSRLSIGTALVRFDTELQDRSGRAETLQPWIAVIRFRYTDAAMRLEDRLVNPLGFQVVGYRRDAETPPPSASVQSVIAASPPAVRPIETTTSLATPLGSNAVPAPPRSAIVIVRPSAPVRHRSREPDTEPTPRIGALKVREVPLNQLPLGSPLSPVGAPIAAADIRGHR